MAQTEKQQTSGAAVVVSATFDGTKAAEKSMLKAVSEAVSTAWESGRKAWQIIAEQCIELRSHYLRDDGIPDWRGQSGEYRASWGKVVSGLRIEDERERRLFSDSVNYHVARILTPAFLAEHKLTEAGTVPVLDEAGRVTKGEDGKIVTTDATAEQVAEHQLRSRKMLPEQRAAAVAKRSEGRTSSAATAGVETGKETTAVGEAMAAFLGQKTPQTDEARDFGRGTLAAVLAPLDISSQLEIVLSGMVSIAEAMSKAEQIAEPDHVRALLGSVNAAVRAAAKTLEEKTTPSTTEAPAKETAAA